MKTTKLNELKSQGTCFGGLRGRSELPSWVEQNMKGEIDIDKIITHHMPVNQVALAFDAMKKGDSIRTVVDLWGEIGAY
jgi:S-(hydroxymethyl)glutathione dehydrogenase/alcohol dehydrogenase